MINLVKVRRSLRNDRRLRLVFQLFCDRFKTWLDVRLVDIMLGRRLAEVLVIDWLWRIVDVSSSIVRIVLSLMMNIWLRMNKLHVSREGLWVQRGRHLHGMMNRGHAHSWVIHTLRRMRSHLRHYKRRSAAVVVHLIFYGSGNAGVG